MASIHVLDVKIMRNCLLAWACISAIAFIIGGVQGMDCPRPGTKKKTKCPEPGDDADKEFCCVADDDNKARFCCNAEQHKIHGALFSSTIFSSDVIYIFALVVMVLIVTGISYCIKLFVWMKWRDRRRAAESQGVELRPAPPSTDATGRPLYPTQQYHPDNDVHQQNYGGQKPGENSFPLNGPSNYGGGYPAPQQPSNGPDIRSSQPFTYGPGSPAARTQTVQQLKGFNYDDPTIAKV